MALLEDEAMEALGDAVKARGGADGDVVIIEYEGEPPSAGSVRRKPYPAPEMPVGETRYAFPEVAGRVSDCAMYLAQCQSKVEECDRAMTRATNELARATKTFDEARKVAEAWTKQMQDRLDEMS